MRTPPQWTFFTVQPVTQWKVETCSTLRQRAQLVVAERRRGCSTSPPTVSRQVAWSNVGIESASV